MASLLLPDVLLTKRPDPVIVGETVSTDVLAIELVVAELTCREVTDLTLCDTRLIPARSDHASPATFQYFVNVLWSGFRQPAPRVEGHNHCYRCEPGCLTIGIESLPNNKAELRRARTRHRE